MHLARDRQSAIDSRGIEKAQLGITATSKPVDNLSVGLVPLGQFVMRDSRHVLALVHAGDKIGLLHVAIADVVCPRNKGGVLVVIQGDGVRQGIGEGVLIRLFDI